ncbi:MAG: ABC transporter substrate-binding protein [Deltaproteobacteria bacterium]|nr:ABC transporter substrate-binding protein [Deltaproteobacteria bacterium]
MAIQVRDDRKRALTFSRHPRRVVSLVPSDTLTVARLLGVDALVGRTDYCIEPAGEVERVPSVGGTKDYSVEKILDLRPDVVIANQEENTRATLEKLAQEGAAVFVVFPRRVEDGVALVARYARLFGVEGDARAKELVRACHRALEAQRAVREGLVPLRTFCPIWMDPLMTVNGDTYISDALDLAGAQNVFADRERRYPLAADLGNAPPLPPERVEGRDTRYPRVTFEEVVARAPEAIVLPDEPHPFSEDDAARFRALDVPAAKRGRVAHVDGKDVCWYGAWAAEGIPRLAATIAALR